MKYKKILIILSVVLTLCTLVGCGNVSKNTQTTSFDTDVNAPTQEDNQNGQTFTSKKLGVSIDFPKSWTNNFIVAESCINNSNIGYIEVRFFGKSMTGVGLGNGLLNSDGMPMFYIGTLEGLNTRNGVLDNMKKIGTFKGKEYYYATVIVNPEEALKDTKRTVSGIPKDKKELDLEAEDLVTLKKMEKQVDDVVKTFRVN